MDKAKITIPAWTMDVLKLCAPFAGAVLLGFVSFQMVRRDVAECAAKMVKMDAINEARNEMMMALTVRVVTLENKHTAQETVIRDSLARIESDVRDVKQDIKQLQRGTK